MSRRITVVIDRSFSMSADYAKQDNFGTAVKNAKGFNPSSIWGFTRVCTKFERLDDMKCDNGVSNGSGTDIGTALSTVFNEISQSHGEQHLILITDADDNGGWDDWVPKLKIKWDQMKQMPCTGELVLIRFTETQDAVAKGIEDIFGQKAKEATGQDLDKLLKQIGDINNRVESINECVTHVRTDISKIKGVQTIIEGQVKDIQKRSETTRDDVLKIATDFGQIKSQIDEIEQKSVSINNDCKFIESKEEYSKLSIKIKDALNKSSDMQNECVKLNQQLLSQEQKILLNQESLEKQQESAVNCQKRLGGANTVSQLKNIRDEIENILDIDANSPQLPHLLNKKKDLETLKQNAMMKNFDIINSIGKLNNEFNETSKNVSNERNNIKQRHTQAGETCNNLQQSQCDATNNFLNKGRHVTLENWLQQHNLHKLLLDLQNAGCNNVDHLRQLSSKDELKQFGLKIGSRNRLWKAICISK